jgi:2-C-methyl-D-erythritol 4-phosphate cytidylyltransferase
MNIVAIVTAGGRSQRFNAGETQNPRQPQNKLLMPLAGRPVLAHTLRGLLQLPQIERVICSASPETQHDFLALNPIDSFSRVTWVEGGQDRRASVFAGLQALEQEGLPDLIVIQDGARPFVDVPYLEQAFACLAECPDLQGVIAGRPVTDTLKYVTNAEKASPMIINTVDRRHLWAVQTPQVFRGQALYHAHQQVSRDQIYTDDAQLLEAYYGPHVMLRLEVSDSKNIKLTTPEDLQLANLWLSMQAQSPLTDE